MARYDEDNFSRETYGEAKGWSQSMKSVTPAADEPGWQRPAKQSQPVDSQFRVGEDALGGSSPPPMQPESSPEE